MIAEQPKRALLLDPGVVRTSSAARAIGFVDVPESEEALEVGGGRVVRRVGRSMASIWAADGP